MLLTAAPASLRPVYASNEKETLKREYIRVEELSMYSSPDIESTYVEHKPSPLEENISLLRHSLTPCTNWCQDSYCKIKPKVETAVEHSKVTYELMKDAPPEFYPRLGVIGFAGIMGLFLARGSKLKKVMYPLGFTGIAASLYFPQQAAIIAKVWSYTNGQATRRASRRVSWDESQDARVWGAATLRSCSLQEQKRAEGAASPGVPGESANGSREACLSPAETEDASARSPGPVRHHRGVQEAGSETLVSERRTVGKSRRRSQPCESESTAELGWEERDAKWHLKRATGSTLYDYGLQGYIAVESLWKDGGKKKKSAKKTAERSEVNSSKPADTSGLESVGVPEKEFIPSTAN